MNNKNDKPEACAKCGSKTAVGVKFCSECGHDLSKPVSTFKMSGKHYVVLIALTAVIWFSGWSLQSSLAGKRPTNEFKHEPEAAHSGGAKAMAANSPRIKELRALVAAEPDNKKAWYNLAAALVMETFKDKEAPPQLIFDAISALRKVLEIDPAHTGALLLMANISYDRQAYAKAAEFYKKYLDIENDDYDVKVRYATAISFMGQHDEAIANLKEVLKSMPDNFQAKANLSMTYSQMGQREEALKIGEEALTLAPSDQARIRFEKFLDTLREPGQSAKSSEQ